MTITPGALMTVPAADAAAATNVHYELPPELFESFLDRRMKYTCALYPLRDATLDEAQETYLAAVADAATAGGNGCSSRLRLGQPVPVPGRAVWLSRGRRHPVAHPGRTHRTARSRTRRR